MRSWLVEQTSHGKLVETLPNSADLAVFVVNYRLLHKHSIEMALEDCYGLLRRRLPVVAVAQIQRREDCSGWGFHRWISCRFALAQRL